MKDKSEEKEDKICAPPKNLTDLDHLLIPFPDMVPWSPGWSRTLYVAKADLTLLILLHHTTEFQGYGVHHHAQCMQWWQMRARQALSPEL